MQSVLEALGNNLVTSPRSKTPPSSPFMRSSPSQTNIKKPAKDHFYETIPLSVTPDTDNLSTVPQQSSTTPSSPSTPAKDYIYDTVPLRNRQQLVVESRESLYAVPRPVSSSPAVSPRTRRRGSESVSQHYAINTSASPTQSPSLDQRCLHYDVPRSTSCSSVPSSPQLPPVQQSNRHQSHYDVPNPTNSTSVSPPPTSCSSSPVSERQSHYDVPPIPIPANRRPPSHVAQRYRASSTTTTTMVTTQDAVQMRRSSADSVVTNTIHPVSPPPVRPRPSPNVSRRHAHTLDRTSGLNLNLMSELKSRTSSISATGNPNS